MDDPSIREQSYTYFVQEAPQLLQVLEQELLHLREDWSINKVHTLMRATHTLKGAAASVGLESIKEVAHSLEDIFKTLCKPDIAIDQETEALLFEAYECLRAPLVAEITGKHGNETEIYDRAAAIFSRLQQKLGDCFDREAYIPTSAELGFDVTQSIFEVGVTQRLEEIARVIASNQPQLVADALQTQAEVFLGLAESLNFSGFGAIATAAIAALAKHPDRALAIAEIALADFKQGQAAILSGDRTSGGEVSQALQELAEGAEVDEADEGVEKATDSLLDAIWSISEPDDEAIAVDEDELGIIPSQVPYETESYSQQRQNSTSTSKPDTVRVNVQHLERLNYLIGELLTNHNRQSLQDEKLQGGIQELLSHLQQQQQMLEGLRDWFEPLEIDPQSEIHLLVHSLLENAEQMQAATNTVDLISHSSSQLLEKQSRLLTSAHDDCLEARMVPLGEVFNRLPLVLQQLSSLHDKPVTLKLSGTKILVDKTIAEKLYDPLLHLVRNAFDHGIEPIEVRSSRGKDRTGEIEIRAFHQGSHLNIEVRDDGQGLDFERIRHRAVEHNKISPQQALHLNQAQLMDLLFEPGFSTATQVSNISGRGIGLDVVRAQLQAVQGAVSVHSELHRGTTFLLQIPFNLTMAKLFLAQAGATVYALLSHTIEQIIVPQASQLCYWENGKVLRWGKGAEEQMIPVRKLEYILNYSSAVRTRQAPSEQNSDAGTVQMVQLMLLRYQSKLLALEVDSIIAEQELVIRPLDPMIVPPSYIYGGIIQADGRLALAIDGTALAKYVFEQLRSDADGAIASSTHSGARVNHLPGMISSNYLNPHQLELGYENLGAKVLLVDDSLIWRQTLALTLQNSGYQVVQVGDGYEALEQLRSQPDIQLVICDLEMPHLNGFEFLNQRQQDSKQSQIPVIILTSSTGEQQRLLAMELGASAYMNKPYLDRELLATVADLLRKKWLERTHF
ncbi:MAG TPA: hybrid sensor histidine kinase/response regulator [Cyanobacteria bacterium UBA11049]|nr:hybrid sensor histidine kinase/response regulator [Cyanobacteria bacterium UBA11049]